MSESQELFERVGNLVAMAAADGRVGKRELRLIQALCDQWGVPAGVLEELVEDARQGGARLTVPRELEERKLLLKGLIQVAAVDGVIDPGEQQMLEAFSDRVGLEREALEQMLRTTLRKRAAGLRQKKARQRAASERQRAASERLAVGGEPEPEPTAAGKLAPLLLAEESLPRSERAPRRAAPQSQAPAHRRAPLDRPPPQPRLPVGEQAEDVSLDSSRPEVFGEVPWGSRIGKLVRCASCSEKVPERYASCPFCEGPTRRRQLALPALDLGSMNTRIGLGLLTIALLLIGPYLYGSHLASEELESAQHFLEVVKNPSPEDLEEARHVEQERQEKLKQEIAKVREQLKARGSGDEAARLRDLLDRLGDGSSLTQSRAGREAEFRKRFPEAGR